MIGISMIRILMIGISMISILMIRITIFLTGWISCKKRPVESFLKKDMLCSNFFHENNFFVTKVVLNI